MEQTYLRKLDLAVEGSPTRQTLMSPRSRVPSLADVYEEQGGGGMLLRARCRVRAA